MGRTIPTATMLIEQEIDLFLRTYGRGLCSRRERETLYDVFQLSKKHTPACSHSVRLVPFHAILMSLVLEQEKRLRQLVNEFSSLEGNEVTISR